MTNSQEVVTPTGILFADRAKRVGFESDGGAMSVASIRNLTECAMHPGPATVPQYAMHGFSLRAATAAVVCLGIAGCSQAPRTPSFPSSPVTTINIDVVSRRHPISPLIYGVAFASKDQLNALGATSNRSGGNARTRYNWALNASNRASDWFFESIAEDPPVPGGSEDLFVKNTKEAHAEPILTVPTIGWVAKLAPGRGKLASFSVKKYGAQQSTDSWMPDAGNGVRPDGSKITGNDPNDANLPASPDFERGWIEHLRSRWMPANKGGVRYYLMDNEPGLWQDTHRDVHPAGASMDEVYSRIASYASMVKSVDPQASVCGPEEWSYLGAIQSGYDLQYDSSHYFGKHPDRRRHHGWDYYPWLLDRMRALDQKTGRRLLDVLTVHYYPQGGEYGDDVSEAMQLRRNRSTRSLWDPNYVDETWVKDKIDLIPRLKQWVARYYPGTKVGITEYNWGAEKSINGATAQADVLGIFGREGLDMANRWTTPDPSTPVFKAMQMYRNYDGNGSSFGDISVADAAPDADTLSSFAAVRSRDHAITVIVINKALNEPAKVRLQFEHAVPRGDAQVWRLTAANRIDHLASIALKGERLDADTPPQSITLFVIPHMKK